MQFGSLINLIDIFLPSLKYPQMDLFLFIFLTYVRGVSGIPGEAGPRSSARVGRDAHGHVEAQRRGHVGVAARSAAAAASRVGRRHEPRLQLQLTL